MRFNKLHPTQHVEFLVIEFLVDRIWSNTKSHIACCRL